LPPAYLTRRCNSVSWNSTRNPTISGFSGGDQGGFFDEDFDSREAFAPLLVIAIADANQLLVISFEELLCALLTGVNVRRACIRAPPDCWRKTANDWLAFESETKGSISARGSQRNQFTSIPAKRTGALLGVYSRSDRTFAQCRSYWVMQT
jgi:hypothetical protein